MMDINYSFLSLSFIISFIEFLYGLHLYSIVDEVSKNTGLRYMVNAIAGLIYVSIGLSALALVDEIKFSVHEDPEGFYSGCVDNIFGYIVGIAAVAARLQSTMVLSPLVGVWISLTWLTGFVGQTLAIILYTMYVLYRIVNLIYGLMVSLGVALLASERTRVISGSLIASPICLKIYLSWLPLAEPVKTVKDIEFPIKGIFQEVGDIVSALWNGQSGLLIDGLKFTEALVFISFSWSLTVLIILGLSKVFGGIPHVISSRI